MMEHQGPTSPGTSSKGGNELSQANFSQNINSTWITVKSKQMSKHRPQCLLYAPVITGNNYIPLTSQMDKLDKHVSFSLLHDHCNKNIATCRLHQTSKKQAVQFGVLNGSILSAISNTGATASAFKPLDPTVHTGVLSNTTFGGAFGDHAAATTVNKFDQNIQEPAQSVHIVPQVQHSLLSVAR